MANYVSTLLVERWIELIAGIVMLSIWRWIIGRNLRDKIKNEFRGEMKELEKRLELTSQPHPSVKVKGGVHYTQNVFFNPQKTSKKPCYMHYGTKHGDFTVHFDNVTQASRDIQNWLIDNDLVAPLSSEKVNETLENAFGKRR